MKVSLLLQVRGLCLVAGLCALPLRAETDPISAVEKAAGDWVKARAESSRLQIEWSSQHQLLESMVGGLNERAQTLEARRDFLQAKTAKDRDEIAKLEVANKAATEGMQATEAQLKAVDIRLLQLRSALPPRLSAALELPYKSLAAPELSLGERMQLTMTVLNRCTQFNRGINSEEELLNPGGEKEPQLLEVIYWGLSHGYALDRAKGRAWFGTSGPAGWRWEPVPEGTAPVAKLLAIYRGKGEPVFVDMPARLKGLSAEARKN